MSRFRSDVLHWFEAGRVSPGRELEVLRVAEMVPSRADWRDFLERLALWLGIVALAAAVVFFFAFNWDALGRFARFGLVEGAILAALVACWRLDLDGRAGKAVLLLLSLLTGALLALAGQTYQTGADSWELFAWWAALILPWVLVGRFSPLWLLWLALLNLAVFLHFRDSWDGQDLLWALFGLNLVALIAWEAAHRAGLAWLRDDWPPRLVAVAAGAMATGLALWAILEDNDPPGGRWLAVLGYVLWLGGTYGWYRRLRPDLFMLAGGVLSVIITATALLSKHLLGTDSMFAFLFIGLAVIAMSAGGAIWLRSVHREQGG